MPAWALEQADKILSLALSYGHGIPGTDDSLPSSEGAYSIWLSPTTWADIPEPGQVREWVSRLAHRAVQLDVRVDAAQLNGTPAGATVDVVITKNGTPTAVSVTVPTGATANTTFTTAANLAIAAGDRVGVALVTSRAMDDASTFRGEVLVRFI